MILFPAAQLEIRTPLTVSEAERVIEENTVHKKSKGYHGRIRNSEFRLGCARYMKIPVSLIQGQIGQHEAGSIVKISIRPTYVQFFFPLIFIVLAVSRVTTDISQFFQITMISVMMIGLLMILYRYSIKKDIAFINRILLGLDEQFNAE